MILWWVRIFNDFEVNSKETFNPLSYFLSHHFFFILRQQVKSCVPLKEYERVYSLVPQFGAHTCVYKH